MSSGPTWPGGQNSYHNGTAPHSSHSPCISPDYHSHQMPQVIGVAGLGMVQHGSRYGWNERAQPLTIAEKKLIPIIVTCATWGRSWQGKHITCYCDNQVVVACLRSRTSRHMGMMHLIRCLAFVEARLKFTLASTYVTTKSNFLADDLSRNQLPSFHLKAPLMDRQPTQTPLALMHLLLNERANWTSSQWRPQFSAIFKQD